MLGGMIGLMAKTVKMRLETVKESDGWQELASKLKLTEEQRDALFEFGEYATLDLEFERQGDDVVIVGGRLVRRPW